MRSDRVTYRCAATGSHTDEERQDYIQMRSDRVTAGDESIPPPRPPRQAGGEPAPHHEKIDDKRCKRAESLNGHLDRLAASQRRTTKRQTIKDAREQRG